ncbi:hypothetical protein HGM15179_011355 [Zosterops borbonicus]|uniref:Uncharacterized protein n=1 Tax=Zosterops borbonicus TaxID=364589 RepID=A0A8K1GCW0_9PASS|nr:hypothetical protein HGM15179_011355 [Zosterops borbonicus]
MPLPELKCKGDHTPKSIVWILFKSKCEVEREKEKRVSGLACSGHDMMEILAGLDVRLERDRWCGKKSGHLLGFDQALFLSWELPTCECQAPGFGIPLKNPEPTAGERECDPEQENLTEQRKKLLSPHPKRIPELSSQKIPDLTR